MRIYSCNLPENLIDLEKNSDLHLKIGDLLTAKILKVSSKKALLELQGQKIVADLNTALHSGDEIKVRVVGELNNKLILRLLTEGTSQPSSIDQLLDKLGIEANSNAKNALAFLLKNNLPITTDSVKALITDQNIPLQDILLKIFGDQAKKPETSSSGQNSAKQENSQIVTSDHQQLTPAPTSEKTATPLDENLWSQLPKLRQLTQSEDISPEKIAAKFGKQSPENNQLPNKLAATVNNGQSATDLPGNNRAETSFLPQQTKQMLTSTGEGHLSSTNELPPKTTTPIFNDLLPEQLNSEALLKSHNLSGEKAELLTQREVQPGSRSNLPELLITDKPVVPEISSKPALNRLNRAELLTRSLAPTAAPALLEELGLAINPQRSLPEIIRGLKSLMELLGLGSKSEESAELLEEKPATSSSTPLPLSSPLSEEQKEGVKELLDKFMGIRLRQKADDLLLHLEIPLLFNEQVTAVLQIREDNAEPTEKLKNNKPLHILFQLQMEELGKIKILLLLAGKEINCQFSAQSAETRMLIRKMIPDLEKRLEKMPYQINHIGVSTLNEAEITAEEPIFGQIDFRV